MMNRRTAPSVILIAEDDEDDFILIQKTMRDAHFTNELRRVRDGEELMDYLHRRGAYPDVGLAPCPALILLDLNMPKKDGREALEEIKTDPGLKSIPVVVFTTSGSELDAARCYRLGANSYLQKPVRYEQYADVIKTVGKYWFELVTLPPLKEQPCGGG